MPPKTTRKTAIIDTEVKGKMDGNFEINPYENSALEIPGKLNEIQKKGEFNWFDYIPIKKILAILVHPFLVSIAMGGFAFTIWLAGKLFPDEPLKSILHWIDTIGIAMLMIVLLCITLQEIITTRDD